MRIIRYYICTYIPLGLQIVLVVSGIVPELGDHLVLTEHVNQWLRGFDERLTLLENLQID